MDAECSFRATPSATHKLQQVLQRIAENDGNVVAKEIWRDESEFGFEQANQIDNMDASISTGNSRPKRLTELLGLVGFLKSSLETCVSDVCLRRRKRTLMDLPDELLALIFEMIAPGLPELMGWSLVCRTIRRISISTPRLWARQRISTSMSPTMIDKILSRSGSYGHNILVKSPLVPNDALSKHCHRWSDITLYALTPSDFQLFQSLTPSSKLISLCSLSLEVSYWNPTYQEFNSDWCPPNLKRLDCYWGLPSGLSASSLTYCSFHFNRDIDIHQLATFLSAAPLLETLYIMLEFTEAFSQEDALIELPSLRNFSFSSQRADQHTVMTMLQAISAPKITTLTIDTFERYDADGLDFDLRSCFWTVVKGIKSNFKHLERLDLKVACEEPDGAEDYDTVSMDELLASLPNSIKSLSLTISGIVLCANRGIPFGIFKDLRSVEFEDCDCLDSNFFVDLAARLKEEKILLDVFDIQGCQEIISEKSVEEELVKMVFRDAGVLQP